MLPTWLGLLVTIFGISVWLNSFSPQHSMPASLFLAHTWARPVTTQSIDEVKELGIDKVFLVLSP